MAKARSCVGATHAHECTFVTLKKFPLDCEARLLRVGGGRDELGLQSKKSREQTQIGEEIGRDEGARHK